MTQGWWYQVWVSLSQFGVDATCFTDSLTLEYTGEGHVSDPPGVTTQTPDAVDDPAGAIKALECIFRNDVPNLPGVTPEELNAMGECQGLGVLFDALRDMGYSDGEDLFGFPYDWRRGPVEWIATD